MNTALLDPAALDDDERKFVSTIREHGWYNTHIFAEGDQPQFSFTTGFWVTIGQHEIIVFGLKSEIAHAVLWDIFRAHQAGTSLPTGSRSDAVFGNLPACLFNVDKAFYPEHLGWSRWFYAGDDFPCRQLVWPDRGGVFPWEPGFDQSSAALQPDISEGGWGEFAT